jgi:glycosyltransferase involved in cell wall biosynthesis
VIVEAFSKGLPVVGSRLGSIEELIDHGRTGMLFEPDNPEDLADTVEWMFAHPDDLWRMSDAARSEFEAKYTSDRNYEQLMDIYHRAQTISQLHKS